MKFTEETPPPLLPSTFTLQKIIKADCKLLVLVFVKWMHFYNVMPDITVGVPWRPRPQCAICPVIRQEMRKTQSLWNLGRPEKANQWGGRRVIEELQCSTGISSPIDMWSTVPLGRFRTDTLSTRSVKANRIDFFFYNVAIIQSVNLNPRNMNQYYLWSEMLGLAQLYKSQILSLIYKGFFCFFTYFFFMCP